MKNLNKLLPLLIIVFASLLRLLPHPPNFSPIAAMALFGSVFLPLKLALVVPFSVMFLSDIFLGFHSTMPWVYGSFVLIAILGTFLRPRLTPANNFKFSLLSSFLFFFITNFGVWLSTSLYPQNFNGLINCYIMAIPFFRNTLAGDLFYNVLFFGSYYLAQNRFTALCSSLKANK